MGVFGSGPQDRGMLGRQARPSCSFVPGGSRVEWGPAWGAARQDRTGGGKNGVVVEELVRNSVVVSPAMGRLAVSQPEAGMCRR